MNTEIYDYREAVKEDIKNYLEENGISLNAFGCRDRAFEKLYDDLWIADSVTGNTSGSYTFNAWRAEEYLRHNTDLLGEALSEFGGSFEDLRRGAEFCDVSIRCYLLSECLSEVLDELFEEDDEDNELKE